MGNAVPAQPAAPTATALSSSSAVVNFTPLTSSTPPVTGYTVSVVGQPSLGCSAPVVTGNPAPTQCSVNSLTPGQTYTFTVSATNAMGNGPESAPSTPLTMPVAPTLSGTPAMVPAGTLFTFTPSVGAASTQPITFSVDPATPLPAWLALDAATGTLSGTPPTAGSFAVTLVGTNAAGAVRLPLTITVAAAVPVPTLGTWALALLGMLTAWLGRRRWQPNPGRIRS